MLNKALVAGGVKFEKKHTNDPSTSGKFLKTFYFFLFFSHEPSSKIIPEVDGSFVCFLELKPPATLGVSGRMGFGTSKFPFFLGLNLTIFFNDLLPHL